MNHRDDRTRRTLELVVGVDRVDVSLTHFSAGHVEVWATVETLQIQNGVLTVTACLNMLSRFVGGVELCVVGQHDPVLCDLLETELKKLRRIDTRPGRSVSLTWMRHEETALRNADAAARVWIGGWDTEFGPNDVEKDIAIAFDGWTCLLRRGTRVPCSKPSPSPFGALCAACFAVAEVFKTLVTDSVPLEESSRFSRRYTHAWSFNAWTMKRGSNSPDAVLLQGPENPGEVSMNPVLQVGAGAVGNATALALSATPWLTGTLQVLDYKLVDDKNLNRCYYFDEDQVERPKVHVLEEGASRPGFEVLPIQEEFKAAHSREAMIVLSTVDNNDVRHRMQETLPEVLVEGATGGTTISISVHSPGNGRSCLVCRHPDPELGLTRHHPLSILAAAEATGLTEDEISSGIVGGVGTITDEVIARVSVTSSVAADILRRARDDGRDLCGALGDLRSQLGTVRGPREASVPFVSNLAGVLAAAEVVKALMRAQGEQNAPSLENVLQLDLARDYSRHDQVAFAEPPRTDCSFCQGRAAAIAAVRAHRTQNRQNRVTI